MANFLDNDHLVSLDSIVKVLNAEIQWCYQHSDGANGTFRGPFISGLEQAKYLIIKMAEAGDCVSVQRGSDHFRTLKFWMEGKRGN